MFFLHYKDSLPFIVCLFVCMKELKERLIFMKKKIKHWLGVTKLGFNFSCIPLQHFKCENNMLEEMIIVDTD